MSYTPPAAGAGCPSQSLTGNNGNIWGVSLTLPKVDQTTLTLNQDFEYDCFGRLTTSSEAVQGGASSWARTNAYDVYGNRAVTGTAIEMNPPAPTSVSQFDPLTNRVAQLPDGTPLTNAYDAAGNMVDHGLIGQMTYDAENRLAVFSHSEAGLTSTGTYQYDGDGNRIKPVSTIGGVMKETYYVYDALGRLASEFSPDEATGFGGVEYRTADHLGSTRVVTNDSGGVVARRDFFPFGEGVPNDSGDRSLVSGYTTSPAFSQLFTDKERDAESNLDYFKKRYASMPQGRFLSPDRPFRDQYVANPQSWNLFAYVRNNPLGYPDIDGGAAHKSSVPRKPVPGASGYTFRGDIANPHDNPSFHIFNSKGKEIGRLSLQEVHTGPEGQGGRRPTAIRLVAKGNVPNAVVEGIQNIINQRGIRPRFAAGGDPFQGAAVRGLGILSLGTIVTGSSEAFQVLRAMGLAAAQEAAVDGGWAANWGGRVRRIAPRGRLVGSFAAVSASFAPFLLTPEPTGTCAAS